MTSRSPPGDIAFETSVSVSLRAASSVAAHDNHQGSHRRAEGVTQPLHPAGPLRLAIGASSRTAKLAKSRREGRGESQ